MRALREWWQVVSWRFTNWRMAWLPYRARPTVGCDETGESIYGDWRWYPGWRFEDRRDRESAIHAARSAIEPVKATRAEDES